MTPTSFPRRMHFVMAILLLAFSSMAGAQMSFNSIVVFGSSLSDSGNAFTLLAHPVDGLALEDSVIHNTPPYDNLDEYLIPVAPYARGGHHLTNGATWVEQLARARGMPAYTKAAFQSNGKKARNYAVGGARATDYQGRVNLPQQLLAFLDDVKGVAPADALYVIEMGNNDVRDALVEFSTVYYTALMQGKTEQEAQGEAQAAAGVVIGNALNGIAEHMQMLHYYGARKFLVWTAARIDLTPAVQGMGPETVYIAGMLTDGFNAGLADTLGMLSDPLLGLPEVQIVPLDVSTLMLNVIASPANFGLANVTDPCVKPDTPPFVCKKPNTYFFWDGIHPTKVVHSMIRQLAETALAAYPSP